MPNYGRSPLRSTPANTLAGCCGELLQQPAFLCESFVAGWSTRSRALLVLLLLLSVWVLSVDGRVRSRTVLVLLLLLSVWVVCKGGGCQVVFH